MSIPVPLPAHTDTEGCIQRHPQPPKAAIKAGLGNICDISHYPGAGISLTTSQKRAQPPCPGLGGGSAVPPAALSPELEAPGLPSYTPVPTSSSPDRWLYQDPLFIAYPGGDDPTVHPAREAEKASSVGSSPRKSQILPLGGSIRAAPCQENPPGWLRPRSPPGLSLV